MIRNKLLQDPFRFFFFLGTVLAISGLAVWIPLIFNPGFGYPLHLHQSLMIDGFLMSFVIGFLTTAVPRFTSSEYIGEKEFLALSWLLLSAVAAMLFNFTKTQYSISILTLICLGLFARRRFVKRKQNPPFSFIFVGVGLILWLLSLTLKLTAEFFEPIKQYNLILNNLHFYGALTSLIIGIGSRLIPGIFEWTDIVSHQRQQYEKPLSFQKVIPKSFFFLVGLFVLSFPLYRLHPQISFLIQASIIAYIAIRYWKLYKAPKAKSYLTWSIWTACWSLVIGMFFIGLAPQFGAHGKHILFVSGFTLLTYFIATRVTLAHSNRGKKPEQKAKALIVIAGLIHFAMLTRVSAFLMETGYLRHLGYASITLILALIIWLYYFGKLMIKGLTK